MFFYSLFFFKELWFGCIIDDDYNQNVKIILPDFKEKMDKIKSYNSFGQNDFSKGAMIKV